VIKNRRVVVFRQSPLSIKQLIMVKLTTVNSKRLLQTVAEVGAGVVKM